MRVVLAAACAASSSGIAVHARLDPPQDPLAVPQSGSGRFLIVDADGGPPQDGEFPGVIFSFDPVTRRCETLCADPALLDPEDIVRGLDGSIFIVDFGAHQHEISSVQGRIHRIDATSGRLLRTYEPVGLRGPTTVFPLTENLLLIGDRAANREPGGHAAVYLLDLTTGYLQIALNDERYRVPSAFARDRDGSLLMLDADAKADAEAAAEGVVFRIDPFKGTSRIDSVLEGTISPLGMLVLEDGDLLIFDANADPKQLGAPIGALFRHHRTTQRTECILEVPRFRDPVRGTFGPDGRVWFVDANSDPEKRGPDAPGRGQNLTGPGAVFAYSVQERALELIGSPLEFVNPTGILWRP